MHFVNDRRPIVCGKLDNQASLGILGPKAKSKFRLHAERLALEKRATPVSVSAEENRVWFDSQFWKIEDFLFQASKIGIRRLLVLTNQEYLCIAEKAAAQNISVDILEDDAPFMPGIKYSRCARANYDVLQRHLRKLNQLQIRIGSFSTDLACVHQRSVVKSLRFKNGFDRNFFFAYKDPYQEVFKLKEERPDRLIIALDFNSMYLDSMSGIFCNPASIEYGNFRGADIKPGLLQNGIYLVRLLSARQGFMLDHHPFRYKRLGKSYYFKMREGDSIETVLHKAEIEYFANFFERIEVIEGLFTSDTIEHPLLAKGKSIYKQRLYHAKRGDRIKENICKASIQHMHSATNQKRFTTATFSNLRDMLDFVSITFSLNTKGVSEQQLTEFISRHKYFNVSRSRNGYKLTYLDTASRVNVYSLSAQVIANARLKILKTLELFLAFPSVELCYANVDSIHISIRRDLATAFLEQHCQLISAEIGALKVEAIADQGYWFDVGRYWLKKEGGVVIYKNKGFSKKEGSDNFVHRRRFSSLVETPTFCHLRSRIAKMENSFSYHKRLIDIDPKHSCFSRFLFDEISGRNNANLTEAKERFRSTQKKIQLFHRISDELRLGGLGI